MFSYTAKKIFGSRNDRYIKTLQSFVKKINEFEPEIEKLSDENLRSQTEKLRDELKNGKTLDDILCEAFATVREAAKRTLGQRHYDVQLIGGIILHRGKIAEMKTGEGKTLVSTLAAYLNAIEGKGVHIVTVNDYLAKRDSKWMGQIFNFLGLTVGCIFSELSPDGRREAYQADITYGTNNEFGFDYLRDNMRFSLEDMVQRKFNYAIVDEVDSILIDEARTPLIISGPVEDKTGMYKKVNKYIPILKAEYYELDEKDKNVSFNEEGTSYIEDILKKDGLIKEGSELYDIENIQLVHHLNQALKAHKIFEKDKDYIVKDGQVIIIDEFTGRMMAGRRFSDGLHQALEAKENVNIKQENQTLASITFQNYFRLYPKLSGMTGTALTEATEFDDIYKLDVIAIPTHRSIARKDDDDDIYKTGAEKYDAIIALIKEANQKKQPILAGTASIEQSEYLSRLLKKQKIKHKVLNARYHTEEATIIAQAGRPSSVTIATNMAGRGTDIQLGGNLEMLLQDALKDVTDKKQREKITQKTTKQFEIDKKNVLETGGLCVIGTERHESRRIDNQLRGRSGRQGDPGFSKFFLSTEDDLIRIFGTNDKMRWVMDKLGQEGEPITHPLITKLMEKSQKKVEARNYEIRKNLLKFDDVMNDQRQIIYEQRIELMEGKEVSETIESMRENIIEDMVARHMPEKSYHEEWDIDSLEKSVHAIFGLRIDLENFVKTEGVANEEVLEKITKETEKIFVEKEAFYGVDIIREMEKKILLFTLDELWKDHLLWLDNLRQGINLRAYGQRDPLNEYKKEAFIAFEKMLNSLKEKTITRLAHAKIHSEEELQKLRLEAQNTQTIHDNSSNTITAKKDLNTPQGTVVKNKPAGDINKNDPSTWGKVARNAPCPCGSGKKYKHCHGKIL